MEERAREEASGGRGDQRHGQWRLEGVDLLPPLPHEQEEEAKQFCFYFVVAKDIACNLLFLTMEISKR
jgi:hypothetical protein